MKVSLAEGVFEELVSMSEYLADHNEEIAYRFLDACNSTFVFLSENRNIGTIRKFEDESLSEVRMWRVKGFENISSFTYRRRAESEFSTYFTAPRITIEPLRMSKPNGTGTPFGSRKYLRQNSPFQQV